MDIKKISPLLLKGKKVLLRLDLNSAVYKNKVLINPRIKAHAKTVKWLSENGAKTIILAHQGRKNDKDYLENLNQHAKLLSAFSKIKVDYVNDLFGSLAKKRINSLEGGEAILLKNVRAYKDEINLKLKTNKFINFSKQFDLYINDAFSVCHRNQGSIIIPSKFLPSFAGPVLYAEVNSLKKFITKSKNNLLISLGGEKVSDYISLLNVFGRAKTKFILGGVLANLFLMDKGFDFGYESKWLKKNNYVKKFYDLKQGIYNKKLNLILPKDFAINKNGRKEVILSSLPINKKIMDIGERTIKEFKKEIKKAKVVLVKGPMGFSEVPGFEKGTVEVLKEIAKRTKEKKLYSLIGGGHSTTTLEKYNIKGFSHVSLSGGALIRYISGEKLPGLEVLKKK